MLDALTDGIGRALEPVGVVRSLLCRKNVHKPSVEHVELVTLDDMFVQRRRIELCQNEDLVHIGVQAVADRNVDDAILSSQRNGGFAPLFSQRIEPRAPAAAHDYSEDICLHHRSLPGSLGIIKEF